MCCGVLLCVVVRARTLFDVCCLLFVGWRRVVRCLLFVAVLVCTCVSVVSCCTSRICWCVLLVVLVVVVCCLSCVVCGLPFGVR